MNEHKLILSLKLFSTSIRLCLIVDTNRFQAWYCQINFCLRSDSQGHLRRHHRHLHQVLGELRRLRSILGKYFIYFARSLYYLFFQPLTSFGPITIVHGSIKKVQGSQKLTNITFFKSCADEVVVHKRNCRRWLWGFAGF